MVEVANIFTKKVNRSSVITKEADYPDHEASNRTWHSVGDIYFSSACSSMCQMGGEFEIGAFCIQIYPSSTDNLKLTCISRPKHQ